MKVSLLKKVRKNYEIYRIHDEPLDRQGQYNYEVSYKKGQYGVLDHDHFVYLNSARNWIVEHVNRKWWFYFAITNFKERCRRANFKAEKRDKIKQSRKVFYNEKN